MNSKNKHLSPVLFHVGWRYILRHPLQSLLMILGITLGVAVVIAIDIANASASRAFDLSVDVIAGKATHQIVGGPDGLDERVYTDLRRSGVVLESAPILVDYVLIPVFGETPIQLLGVDPFVEAPFRNYLNASNEPAPASTVELVFGSTQHDPDFKRYS